MKKLRLTEIWIESTRRCNMSCRHCCRGDAQDIDMNSSVIESLFKQVEFIGLIGFTGGESSLVSNILSDVLNLAKKYKVQILSFQVVTNGKEISDEFIQVLKDWYNYCEHNMSTNIFISKDKYHEKVDNSKLLNTFPGIARERDTEFLTAEGRLWNHKKLPKLTQEEVVIIDNHIDSILYLNCFGDVFVGVDWSYDSQMSKAICNINSDNILKDIYNWSK